MKIEAEQGGRNTALTREAGRLRGQGKDEGEIFAALLDHRDRQGLPEAEVRAIARSIAQKPSGTNGNRERPPNFSTPMEELAYRRGWSLSVMRSLGVRVEKGNVLFPMRNAKGRIVGHRKRRGNNRSFTVGGGKQKALTGKGENLGLFFPDPFPKEGDVLLCEGEADTVAALSAGWPCVVGTAGSNPGRIGLESLSSLLCGRAVVLFPDPDADGRKWRKEMAGLLKNSQCVVSYVAPIGDKDLDATLRHETDKQKALEGLLARKQVLSDDEEEIGDNGKVIFLVVAKRIMAGRHIINIGGDFHEYAHGVYQKREPWVYKQEIQRRIGNKSTKAALANVMECLAMETAIGTDRVYGGGQIVNLSNGLLYLENAELRPHTPDHISTVQIPIHYDENAECPQWERCLGEWLAPKVDVVQLLKEWFGYCLTPDTRQHKAMVFVGEGANGKSVVCEILRALVGDANTSALGLATLSRSFAVADLFGKLVNLATETEIRDGIDEGIFKQLVAGDTVAAERKFRDPFTFTPTARFTIATNNLFHVNDRSSGFYRRLLIVRFERIFDEASQDRELLDKLRGELSGILNWALCGLHSLKQRGRFLVPECVQNEVAEYQRQNNPVQSWFEECAVADPTAWTASNVLYKSYRRWSEDNGHHPLGSTKFGVEIRRIGGIKPRRGGPRDSRQRGYAGIRLNVTE